MEPLSSHSPTILNCGLSFRVSQSNGSSHVWLRSLQPVTGGFGSGRANLRKYQWLDGFRGWVAIHLENSLPRWPNFVEVSIVMGGTPVAGWFIREIPSIFQWMIWAFPHSWTPPPSWELLDIIHYMYYYDLKYVYNYYYMYIVFHMHYNYYIIHCPESMGISATGGGRDYPLTHWADSPLEGLGEGFFLLHERLD